MFLGCQCCKCSTKNYYVGFEDCYGASSGSQGVNRRKFIFEPSAGKVYLIYNAYSVPDKFTVFIDGEEVDTTGYVGDPSWGTSEIEVVGPGLGCLIINKPFGVTEIEIEVEAPIGGTGWYYRLSCLLTDEREPKEFKHFVGNDGGKVNFDIVLLLNSDAGICGNITYTQRVLVEIFDFNNLENLLFREEILLEDVVINKSFYKPSGITDLLIRITYVGPGLDITSIRLTIGCPQPTEIDEIEDIIKDAESGDDISEGANENDFIISRPSIGGNPRDRTRPSNPPSGGYFPISTPYNCGARTFTNINEPFCYNLNIIGYYVSSDPEISFYYTSRYYPIEAGKIIFNFYSGNSTLDGKKTPIRRFVVVGYYDEFNYQVLHDTGRIEGQFIGSNICTLLSKPEGVSYIRIFAQEDNPDESRALAYANLSCLLTEEDLFQVNPQNSIYASQIFSRGELSGIVDFYASIYSANDLFVGCIGNPIGIVDSIKDLPKARFIVKEAIPDTIIDEDGNRVDVYNDGEIFLDFILDASVELDNIPPVENLSRDNTFVDKLDNFFKTQQVEYVKVEVQYTRNTVFRYTIGCPRPSCLSRCNFPRQPRSILVKLSGEDYGFAFNRVGCRVWKFGNIMVSYPLDYPYKDIEQSKEFWRFLSPEFVEEIEYSAAWAFPGGAYDGEFVLDISQDGTYYEYTFDDDDDKFCLRDGLLPKIILSTDFQSSCSLVLQNFKAFYKFGLPYQVGFNFENTFNCDSLIDYTNWNFYSHTIFNKSYAIGCDNLFGQDINYFMGLLLSAYGSNYRSAYELSRAIVNGFRIFPVIPYNYTFDLRDFCGSNNIYESLYFGGADVTTGYVPGFVMRTIRENCFSEDDNFIPRFYFPYAPIRMDSFDAGYEEYLRGFTTETGKPYIIVKSLEII